jgi:PAS domain S-box-containing protein
MHERRRFLVSYGVAVAATLTALFVRWLLNPLLDHRLSFITLYGAVAVAAWFGGWRPALLATILGFIAADQAFVETESGSPLSLSGPGGIAGLVVYLLSCLIVIVLGGGMHAAQRRSETATLEALAKQERIDNEMAERLRAEETLRAKEAELELIAQRTPLLLTRCSRERRFLFVNRACAEFLGRRPEDIIGRPIAESMGEDAFAAIAPYIERVLRGEDVEFETEIAYTHPGRRFMRAVYTPDRDGGGRVIGWVASISDVTDQKRAAQALRDNETRLAAEADALARLNELSSRLWRMRSLREGLDEMLAATIELLGADMGNVQILDAERNVLTIAAQRGFERDFLDFFRKVSTRDDSACGRALRSGARMVIEDVEVDAPYAPLRPIARAAGYRAVQATPLIGRDGTPLGMLSTHFRSPHRPGEQDLRRLDLYVRQAADFIERCRTDEVLRRADRQKDEFLATLAHELRNPLAPVRNAIQILRLKGPLSPDVQWARDVIDRQMQQMTRLIDDLMDLSRITRNRIELRKGRVDLARVLHGAVETSRPLIDGSGHELSVLLPPEPLYVDADPARLAQVFANLLNNAARYSERHGRIVLKAERQGSDVAVSVRDQGIGIPEEMLPRIFDSFTQVNRSLERSQGGLGIGLTLVKRLVEMHGGSVAAHSDGAGRGSEFVVRLPVPIAFAAPGSPARPDEPVTDAPACCRLLIVDDNNDAATSLGMMLRILGYETRTAGDGLAGLEAAAEFRPDVLLLDIGMPKLNGYDVARRIREQPWGKGPVLIAVTGWGQAEDRQRSSEAGFDHHLVKPVDPAALTKLLASLATARDRQLTKR